MQVAKTQFYGNYENAKTRHRKYHILKADNYSYCGKYLDKLDIKDGKILFGKRFFKNGKWKKDIVCSTCLGQYINLGFKDFENEK